MRNLLLSVLALALLSQTPTAAPAEPDSLSEAEPAWSGGIEMTGTNNYIWHGMSANKAAIFQPYVWISHKNFTLSLWSSWALTTPKDDIKRPEIDPIITYEFAWRNFNFETYFNYYHYIDQPDDPNTGEVAGIVRYPLGIVTLRAGVICDVMEYSGALYTEEAVEIEKELNNRFTAFGAVTLGAGSGRFNKAYLGLNRATASVLSLDAHVTWTLASGLYLLPWLQYNQTLNRELKSEMNDHSSSFGLTAGKEF